jgi:threonine dehydrogenase-like Zn-dependent dehydrogenase
MSVAVFGLGPIGQMAARLAVRQGATVIGIDPVTERRALAERHGATTIDPDATDDVPGAIVDLTDGLGADRVIDAVGMEAEGSALDSILQATKVQPSRVIALRHAVDAVRRGGTISILGVYAGPIQAFPLDQLFDKQVALHMGQANVMRWMDDLIPLVEDPRTPSGSTISSRTDSPSRARPTPTTCSRTSDRARSRSCSSRCRPP